jgi:hypothetical protein
MSLNGRIEIYDLSVAIINDKILRIIKCAAGIKLISKTIDVTISNLCIKIVDLGIEVPIVTLRVTLSVLQAPS